jgi:hypothetical protein
MAHTPKGRSHSRRPPFSSLPSFQDHEHSAGKRKMVIILKKEVCEHNIYTRYFHY